MRDNRLHYLLSTILKATKTVDGKAEREYNPKFESLRNEMNKPSIEKYRLWMPRKEFFLDEVEFLCNQLVHSGIGHVNSDSISIGAEGMFAKTKGAYYSDHFKEQGKLMLLLVSLSAIASGISSVALVFLAVAANLDSAVLQRLEDKLLQQDEVIQSTPPRLLRLDQSLDSIGLRLDRLADSLKKASAKPEEIPD